MENKEVATIRTITGELIGGYIIYGIIFEILNSIIIALISNIIPSDSLAITAIIAIFLQALSISLVWKFSIATTFRKRAIDKNDVSAVMKNLIIFVIIICIINISTNFAEVNQNINEAINSNVNLNLAENIMKYTYTEEQIAQYQSEKEKTIKEIKSKQYTYLAILETGIVIIYLSIVSLQKKSILKHAV